MLCSPTYYYATGALRSTSLGKLYLVGPIFFGGGPANDNLRGPCQQLLTLLTLKSATVLNVRYRIRLNLSRRNLSKC